LNVDSISTIKCIL